VCVFGRTRLRVCVRLPVCVCVRVVFVCGVCVCALSARASWPRAKSRLFAAVCTSSRTRFSRSRRGPDGLRSRVCVPDTYIDRRRRYHPVGPPL